MLVLLRLLAIQVENKRRKNLLISEPLCQTCILQLKWCFNLEMKVWKIAYPVVNSLLGILGITGLQISVITRAIFYKTSDFVKSSSFKKIWTYIFVKVKIYIVKTKWWWYLVLLFFTLLVLWVMTLLRNRNHEIILFSLYSFAFSIYLFKKYLFALVGCCMTDLLCILKDLSLQSMNSLVVTLRLSSWGAWALLCVGS